MKKEDYINSARYKKLISTLENAINDTKDFRCSSDLTSFQSLQLAIWAMRIQEDLRDLSIYIRNDYMQEFRKDKSQKATINPHEDRVKIGLADKETIGIGINEYTKIHANSFGPFSPVQYFQDQKRIVIVDWEPYTLNGDLEKLDIGKLSFLGGKKQDIDFSTYNSFEAPTHKIAVDFCQQLLSKYSLDLSKDEVMQSTMCILQHNFFPALAFSGNTSSDKDLVQKTWSVWNKELLSYLLHFYSGKIIIGNRDNLNYLCTPYDGLFNVAIKDGNIESEGESTESLLSKYSDAAIIGRKIIQSWFNHKLGGKGASALLDECGTIWIGYVHCASRRGDQWTSVDQEELASWIKRIMPDLIS